jgi:hypothetical protein
MDPFAKHYSLNYDTWDTILIFSKSAGDSDFQEHEDYLVNRYATEDHLLTLQLMTLYPLESPGYRSANFRECHLHLYFKAYFKYRDVADLPISDELLSLAGKYVGFETYLDILVHTKNVTAVLYYLNKQGLSLTAALEAELTYTSFDRLICHPRILNV